MKDLYTIIFFEKKTLLKGFIFSFLLTLPFSFLPILLKSGLAFRPLILRIPNSILYSFGFALIVVVSAVLHNYNSLIDRKKIFDKPAFQSLNFYGRIDGEGNISSDLETFLLGEIGDYYFRINIEDIENKTIRIHIRPFIILNDDTKKNILIKDHNFINENIVEGIFLRQTLNLTNIELSNEYYLKEKLYNLCLLFKILEIDCIILNESIFEE